MEVRITYLWPSRHQKPLKRSGKCASTTEAQPDVGPLAHVVDRSRGHVADTCVLDVQVHEHVVREPVARVQALEVETAERAGEIAV